MWQDWIPDLAISIWTHSCFSSLNGSHWGFQTKFQQYLKLCSACQDEKADTSNYSKNKSKLCYSQQWTHMCLFKFLRKSLKKEKLAKQILKWKQTKSPELWKSISDISLWIQCGYSTFHSHTLSHFHTGIRWKTSFNVSSHSLSHALHLITNFFINVQSQVWCVKTEQMRCHICTDIQAQCLSRIFHSI